MSGNLESSVRCFLGLALPDAVRDALARFTERLRDTRGRVTWVRRDNFHLTIQFLGDVTAHRLKRICAASDMAASDVSPFEFMVAGAGFFGSLRSPRIAWAGVSGPPPGLLQLQLSVAQQLAKLGFAGEKRAYRPHITLGRIRDSRQAIALTSELASANNTTFGTVPVDRLVVLRSHPEPSGVRYSILHESEMKGTEFDGG